MHVQFFKTPSGRVGLNAEGRTSNVERPNFSFDVERWALNVGRFFTVIVDKAASSISRPPRPPLAKGGSALWPVGTLSSQHSHFIAAATLATYAVCVVAGCGGGETTTIGPSSNPPATAPAAGAPATAATPAETISPAGARAPVESKSVREQPRPAPRNSSWPTQRPDVPSGDITPGGVSGAYAIVDDLTRAGSVFRFDLPERNSSADRFAFVSPSPGDDSTRFAMPAETAVHSAVSAAGDAPRTITIGQDTAAARQAESTTVMLPAGFTEVASAGKDADGWPLQIRCEADGAIMALVPGGIGVQGKDGANAEVAPEHGVVLQPFYIDVCEVTHEQYQKYRQAARDSKKRTVAEPARTATDPREPVTGISWAEARAYATATGRDLPTEAQWERAARGQNGFDFPWGNGTYVWERARAPGQLDAVGIFRSDTSPFGICDMAGNAREWCHDWYRPDTYAQHTRSDSTPHDPVGPGNSGGTEQRVVKGGDPHWYVWARSGLAQSQRAPDVGFRCVLALKPAGREAAPTENSRGKKPARKTR